MLHGARTALDGTQQDLDGIHTDLSRLAETLPWLADLADRVQRLDAFNRGEGQQALAVVQGADEAAVTPPVANEDAVWEAVVAHDELMQRVLRIATAVVTSGLDAEGAARAEGGAVSDR
ncbi:hypothetical protein HJ590_10290 [Naumannella sp. ID2617S]|nr:hypothetical protein [Naumannella sp. ID2617S]